MISIFQWALEYGMPSTHAMIGISVPASVIIFTMNRSCGKKNTRQNKSKIFWTPKSSWVGYFISFKSKHHFLKGTNILSFSGSPSPSPGVRSSVAGSLKHLRLDIKYVDYFWLGYVTFENVCQNTHYGSQTIRILTSAECTWACILWLTLLEAFWLPLVFSFSSYH